MEALSVKIPDVFKNTIVLKIPYFQRSYVWREEQWSRFMEDMLDLLETDDSYFLGSIIIKKLGRNNGFDQYVVVDGQQRLTTLVIFSKLLYLLAGRDDKFKNMFILDDDTLSTPVLCPNRKDQAAYKEIVGLEIVTTPIAGYGQVKKAFEYFRDKLNTEDIRSKASALMQAIKTRVNIVRIIVYEDENEQQIFDTINSLGQDLTTGELLKNYLFNENNVDLYDNEWMPVFENGGIDYDYWNTQLTKGRIKANNIENFFYYYMLIKMQDPTIVNSISAIDKRKYRKQEGLFESYKSIIQNQNLEKNALIHEIVEYAKLYRDNFKQEILNDALVNDACVERLSFIMFAQNSWTPVPYILYILKNVQDNNERNRIFEYLESYLVRRIICKSKNNNYSDLFSENLIGNEINTFDGFRAYVNDPSHGVLIMPSDDAVKDAIFQNDLTRESSLLLYLIESKLNEDFLDSSENNGFDSLFSEAIIPVKYNIGNWPLFNTPQDERNVLVKTLGNHLLVRSKLTPSKSVSQWSTKKSALSVSELVMSEDVVKEKLWTDDSIKRRNAELGGYINALWSIN